MRWLTRDWYGSGDGSLTDAEVEELTAAERRHREAVLPLLPDALKSLVGHPIGGRYRSLHDGRIVTWEASFPDLFVLYVVCGDFERGYECLRIEYRDAELVGARRENLAGWFADDRTELLYQEVDALPDGRFEHRHLLWPEGEFGIRFGDISVAATPVTAGDYERSARSASEL